MGGSIGKKKSKIIIVGLDNSGKSTMINLLKPKKVFCFFNESVVRRSWDSCHSWFQSWNIFKKQDRLYSVRYVRVGQIQKFMGNLLCWSWSIANWFILTLGSDLCGRCNWQAEDTSSKKWVGLTLRPSM